MRRVHERQANIDPTDPCRVRRPRHLPVEKGPRAARKHERIAALPGEVEVPLGRREHVFLDSRAERLESAPVQISWVVRTSVEEEGALTVDDGRTSRGRLVYMLRKSGFK